MQNVPFCRVVASLLSAAALHQMQQMLTALQPRLDPSEDPSVRDNAIGALGRLVMAFGSALPLPQILPAIIGSLPLKADGGENIPACRCLMTLAQDAQARHLLGPHMPAILGAIATLLRPESLEKLTTPELQVELAAFVQWLLQAAPEMAAHLPPETVAQLANVPPPSPETGQVV